MNIFRKEIFLTADFDTLTQKSPFYPHSRLFKPKLTIHTPLTIGVSFRQSWWISRYIENIHFVTTKRSVPWLHFTLVQTCSACDSCSNLHALSDHAFPSCPTLDELWSHHTLKSFIMKQQERHDTSTAIMCAVCTHIRDRCRVDILLSKKGNLLGLPHSCTRCCRTVEEIYGLTGILHDIWVLSVFHEKLSPRIAKAVTMQVLRANGRKGW